MTVSRKSVLLPLILLIALLLALFSIIGYIVHLHTAGEPELRLPTPTPRISASADVFATPSATAFTETATPVPADVQTTPDGQFDAYAERFWMDGILRTDADTYRSPDLAFTVRTTVDTKTFGVRVQYYVADVYVRDVTVLKTACYNGDFHHPGRGSVDLIAKRANALLAISGDYCAAQQGSLVIRNGVVYRESLRKDMDVCLLLRDGTMETYRAGMISLKEILEKDVWQAWQFGPLLLNDDGEVRSSFADSKIAVRNPRSCIGYVEPGHYILLVADGRQRQSRGLTLSDLASLMKSLGCKRAFNLDGGASAHFYWRGRILSNPSGGGRNMSDIICLEKEDYANSFYFHGKDGLNG